MSLRHSRDGSHSAPLARHRSAASLSTFSSPYYPPAYIYNVSLPTINLSRVRHPSLSHPSPPDYVHTHPLPSLRELVSKYTRQIIRGVKDGSFELIKDQHWGPGQEGCSMTADEMQDTLGRTAVANLALKAAKFELDTGTETHLDHPGLEPSSGRLSTDSPLSAPTQPPPLSSSSSSAPATAHDGGHSAPTPAANTPAGYEYVRHDLGNPDSALADDDAPYSPADALFTSDDPYRHYSSHNRSATMTPAMSPLSGTFPDDPYTIRGTVEGDMESACTPTSTTFPRMDSRSGASSSSLPLKPTTAAGPRIRKASFTPSSPLSNNPLNRSTSANDSTLQRKASKVDLAKVRADEAVKAREVKYEKEREAKAEKDRAKAEAKRDRELRKQRKEDAKLARELQAKELRQARADSLAAQRAQTSPPAPMTKNVSRATTSALPRTAQSPSPTAYVPSATTMPVLDVVPLPFLTFYVNRTPIKVLIDSGAMLNLIHPHVRNRLGLSMKTAPGQLAGVTGNGQCEGICEGPQGNGVELGSRDPDRYMGAVASSANGSTSSSISTTPADWLVTRAKMVVGPAGGSADAILGMPWIVSAKAEITYHPGTGVWVSFDAEPPFGSTTAPSASPSSIPLSPSSSSSSSSSFSSKVKRLSLLAASEADLKKGYTWPAAPTYSSRHQSSASSVTASLVTSLTNSSRRIVMPSPNHRSVPKLSTTITFPTSSSTSTMTSSSTAKARLGNFEKRVGALKLGATPFIPIPLRRPSTSQSISSGFNTAPASRWNTLHTSTNGNGLRERRVSESMSRRVMCPSRTTFS